MPYYNVEKYVASAIQSVLSQTYTDFELILINDASTDKSARVVEKIARTDSRIIHTANSVNLGIARTCNEALRLSSGEFIVRCDSDDLAMPHRLEKQLAAAEENPEIGIWGCSAYQLGDTEHRLFRRDTDANQATISMLFYIPVINTTFFARRSALELVDTFYDPAVKFEDYDLLVRLAGKTGVCNLGVPLMNIRVNPNSFTFGLKGAEYLKHNLSYQEKLLRRLGVNPTAEELILHAYTVCCVARAECDWYFEDIVPRRPNEEQVRAWFDKIIDANSHSHIFNHEMLVARLNEVVSCFSHVDAMSRRSWFSRILQPWK